MRTAVRVARLSIFSQIEIFDTGQPFTSDYDTTSLKRRLAPFAILARLRTGNIPRVSSFLGKRPFEFSLPDDFFKDIALRIIARVRS